MDYQSIDQAPTSLFEQYGWVYAFCREHLFRDDSRRIATTLWPNAVPPDGCQLLELGCGPGFYACQLAARFEQLHVTGIDSAEQQLHRARRRAAERSLSNCQFELADVCALPQDTSSVDALIAARLFTVVPDHIQVIAEMFRVLQPGGRCFIAEPRSIVRALVPLAAMWFVAMLARCGPFRSRRYREPRLVTVLPHHTFEAVVASQPWHTVSCWHDGWYQYAVCEKGTPNVDLVSMPATSTMR